MTVHSANVRFAPGAALRQLIRFDVFAYQSLTDSISAESLSVEGWIIFYSFIIGREIPFAYERPLPPPNAVARVLPFLVLRKAPVDRIDSVLA